MSLVMSRSMLLPLAFVALSIGLIAQAPTGTITGTVTDESGAVVPNAKISIVNRATEFSRAALANAEGFYSAPALLPGDYEVRCEVPGFRVMVVRVSVQAGGAATANLALEVGTNKEIVSVEAAAAQLEYERNAVDGVVTRQQIQGPAAQRPQLPQFGVARARRFSRHRQHIAIQLAVQCVRSSAPTRAALRTRWTAATSATASKAADRV